MDIFISNCKNIRFSMDGYIHRQIHVKDKKTHRGTQTVIIPLSLALSIKKLAFSVSNYKITMPGLSTHVTSRWEKIQGSNSKAS
jgi:hypothetical protein